MPCRHTNGKKAYIFADLRTLLARASPLRSGDVLAGVAATTYERVAAQLALADVPLHHFLNEVLIPYGQDEVTRLIIDTHNAEAFANISHFTVGQLRDWMVWIMPMM
jgi:ethanolamine ammonia-lyase large subunit